MANDIKMELMELSEITNRAESMGRRGVDLRTTLVDIESRLGRPMNFEEHQAWLSGWWLSERARGDVDKARALKLARAAFPERHA